MKRRLLILSLLTVGCGPLTTEPMPDIPETVEYDTVRIEYGDDDLVPETPNGTSAQMLVGDPSTMAALAKRIVGGTNLMIWGQLRLIEEIVKIDPTSHEEGRWTWNNEDYKGADERFSIFEIVEVEEGSYEYEWRVGNTPDEMLLIFSGHFTPRSRIDGRQRGSGLVRFDFDNIHAVNSDARGPRGRASASFRAVGGVRQVRVATFDLIREGETEPTSSRYEYVQFRDAAGRFRFATSSDFLNDGEPHEHLAVDAVWTPDRAGRALASLTGGSLRINEVLLHECWDPRGRIVFADATPDFDNVPYEDGEQSACAERLAGFDLDPPQFSEPETDPAIPSPHPEESDEDR